MSSAAKSPLYLDHNATTPVDPRVLNAMLPYFTENFGNAASSTHVYGWHAAQAVEKARESLANGIGAKDKDTIFFTSGTTESNNLVIKGLIAAANKPAHVITQATEHKCVLDSCAALRKSGHEVTTLIVDRSGKVDPGILKAALKPNTALVSIMHANNEIGTIQNLARLIAVVRENSQALFHTDAAQSVGKIPLDVTELDIDLLSFSAHKMYGPKGIGALYVAKHSPQTRILPQIVGGGQENGLRSGTLNVPGIIGFAKALELCLSERETEARRQKRLCDEFFKTVLSGIEDAFLNGDAQDRLPGNLNLCIPHVKAEDLIRALPELAFSTGSACASGTVEPSYVLQALGLTADEAKSSVRIAIGRDTNEADLKLAAQKLAQAAKKLQENSLSYQMAKDAQS